MTLSRKIVFQECRVTYGKEDDEDTEAGIHRRFKELAVKRIKEGVMPGEGHKVVQ